MIAPRLAWRNLRRNKRRTALTSISMCIGLAILIINRGMLDGIDNQSILNLTAYDVAHVKAFAPKYLDDDLPNLDYVITDADSLLSVVAALEDISGVTARLEMSGVIIKGNEEVFTRVVGVDPKTDLKVFETLSAIVAGASIVEDAAVGLIGDRLANDLNISVGDDIIVLVRSAPGAINTKSVTICGIISTGHPKVDQFAVYLPLRFARDLALLPGGATEIAVKTDNLDNSEEISLMLKEVIPGLDWRTWEYLASDFLAMARMKRIGSGVIIAVFVLTAAVGIANTMVIAIYERTRELGTLRAIGFSSSLIGRIFLWEGFFIGLVAGAAAVVIGVSVVSWLHVHGISLAAYGDMDIGYPVRDAIYPMITVTNVIFSFSFGLALAVLASWGSARRASRGEVIRALREGML